MGRFKPLLSLGEETVLERVIGVFGKAGVDDVRVVVGHRMEELIPIIERINANVIINPHYSTGMFSSVQAGVNSISSDSEAFFIHPVDIPKINPSTIRKIINQHVTHKDFIIYPCYQGKRGHPPLVPSRLSKDILRANASGRLDEVLASFKKDSMDLEVEDPNILLGMNHPGDYTAMVSGLNQSNVLTDG
jgi:CTP:molybdopterin cytidylyltransferase MocA